MKTWEVIGYTYRADIYCPTDSVRKAYADNGWVPPTTIYLGHEHNLDVLAQGLGIDRYAEETFDSGDFPKVVFTDQITDETCSECGESLLERQTS